MGFGTGDGADLVGKVIPFYRGQDRGRKEQFSPLEDFYI